VYHIAVELPELPEHGVLLFRGQIVEGREEKVLVLFLDVLRIERRQAAQRGGDLAGAAGIAVPAGQTGPFEAADQFPGLPVVGYQPVDVPAVLCRQRLFDEHLEEDILFFAVVVAVRVEAKEVDRHFDEARIDGAAPAGDPVELFFQQADHPLDEPVLPHQRSDWFHEIPPVNTRRQSPPRTEPSR
jgi:hypothetical protein